MRLKTLTAGIVISLAAHAIILLFPSFSDDGQADIGKIEIGVVYLAVPTKNILVKGTLPLEPAQQSEGIPLHSLSKKIDTKKLLKSVKPLINSKQIIKPSLPKKVAKINSTDDLCHQPAQPTPMQRPVSVQSDTHDIPVTTDNYPTGLGSERLEDSPLFSSLGNEPNPSASRQNNLTQAPRYYINPPPNYPSLALKRHWQGEVWLRVMVGEQGEVINASVENSSGHLLLDDAALNTVRNWKFHPAKDGETNVREEVRLPIRFELARS